MSVFPYDVPLLLLVLLALPELRQITRGRPQLSLVVLATLVLWSALALAVTPSLLGVRTLVRVVEAWALAWAVITVVRAGRLGYVVVPLAVQGTFQLVVSAIQVAGDDSLPTPLLGGTNLFRFTPLDAAGQGTFPHPYQLAGIAAVSGIFLAVLAVRQRGRSRAALLLAASAWAACLGLSYSRSSVLALALVLGAAALAAVLRRPQAGRTAAAAAVLVLAAVVAGVIAPGAWTARIDQVTAFGGEEGSGDVNTVTSGRVELTREGLDLAADRPLVGWGPGRYLVALQDKKDAPSTQPLLPVHNVPVLLAAETGVLGGLLGLVLIAAVLRLAFTRGTAGPGLVAAAYLPYLMLDVPYAVPQGIPVLGLWIGLAEALREPVRDQIGSGDHTQEPEEEQRADKSADLT